MATVMANESPTQASLEWGTRMSSKLLRPIRFAQPETFCVTRSLGTVSLISGERRKSKSHP